MILVIIVAGCSEEPHISEVNLEDAEFAPFVEREFPFITTSLLVSQNEELYPENNVAPRCLALILGEHSYACFDTDMLRWAAAWTGDFVPLEGVSQKAYPDFLGRNDQMSYLTESPHIVTGLYPGWNGEESGFSDPRPPAPHPDEPSWGPIPDDIGRWNGVYVTDHGPVLSYTVKGTDIVEAPGSTEDEAGTVFFRTFRIDQPDEVLTLMAAEIPGAIRSDVSAGRAEIYHEDDENVTLLRLSETDSEVTFDVKEDRYVTVKISAADEPVEFTLRMWHGDADYLAEADQLMSSEPGTIPSFQEGGSNRWPEAVITRGKVAPDTSAYVVDELTLPVPNPWNRNVRVVDVDFFEDNSAAVVTFDGDVWLVDGIDDRLNSLRWSRFASGLYETQSIEIVNDEIYVYGKDGITRLHDLNEDGAADFYENFSNLMAQSVETREWASDMVAKPGGGFYAAKGAALDMGPRALTDAVIRGIRAGSQHSGVILEISEDGRSSEIIASGFRGPYLGIQPETGLLTASDQEGHSVPSTPLLSVKKGDYYGVSATAHREPVPETITPPLMWIPHSVDRSGTSQTWITSDQMGPLSGNLIHFSYGRPGLFRVLIDSTGSGAQGGISFIPGYYPVPTMKGAVHPSDGQLYMAGFTLWGTNSDGLAGLLRLRYTGLPDYMPGDFKVRDGGVILHFNEELDEESVREVSNYRVERWNYKRTEDYGSGYFRLDGSPGQELLPVYSAHLSDDGKSIFLAIPNIVVAEQMQVSYSLNASDGMAIEDDFWFTVHHVEPVNLAGEGFSGIDSVELLADLSAGSFENRAASPEPATVERGRELFQRTGCMGCHTTDGSEGTGVGPTMRGLFGSERQFRDGSTAIADEEYIRQALVNPGEQILEGYDEGMPSFLGILPDDEIDSIILFIKSL
ncbi:MAG: DUF6797 domain-containing protein [Balneolaceae bacterium]